MTFKPAHKDTDTPPGQIVNPIDRSKTIGGIIDRVMRSEAPPNWWHSEEKPVKQKLTFEQWLHQSSFVVPDEGTYLWLKDCWKAAQENV